MTVKSSKLNLICYVFTILHPTSSPRLKNFLETFDDRYAERLRAVMQIAVIY